MRSAFEQLAEDGYFLDLDVHFAKTVCSIVGEQDPIIFLSAALTSKYIASGHVCVPIEQLAGSRMQMAKSESEILLPNRNEWVEALLKSPLVGNGNPATPLVLEKGKLYLFRYWRYECDLATELVNRAKRKSSLVSDAALEETLLRLFPDGSHENEEMRRTIKAALCSGLSIISGGPGSGKTFTAVKIVATLLEVAMKSGKTPRMTLLAPTGKAAARLKESIRNAKSTNNPALNRFSREVMNAVPEETSTIHRSLGASMSVPGHFSRNENNPINADLVVIDEASMIDMALMVKLFRAVPKHATVILIGDKDQLASVEAGAVLAEIDIPGKVIQLSKNYRFDSKSGIGALAQAINAGEADCLIKDLKAGCFEKVELIEPAGHDERSVETLLKPYVSTRYANYFKEQNPEKRLASLGSFRILTAHRQGLFGVEGVNRLAKNILKGQGLLAGNSDWYDGRPIIVTQNDYNIGVYNGDLGVTCKHESELRVFFEAENKNLRSISTARLGAVETAFAMTVHKSQGSEVDEVLVILPIKHSKVSTRQLLYTAVTRARKRVTIVSTIDVLKNTILSQVTRAIGLRDRIV